MGKLGGRGMWGGLVRPRRFVTGSAMEGERAEEIARSPKILITGSCGQIGSELTLRLRELYGSDNVIATDVRRPFDDSFAASGPFFYADVLRYSTLERLTVEFDINTIIHLSGVLSAVGERDHIQSLRINVDGSRNALEIARRHRTKVFIPSSIAAFGPDTPLDNTPDTVIQRPDTVYGISKVFIENLGNYYHKKFGVDFRSLRYPGVINAGQPGGGTTDYAVEMFFAAQGKDPYQCWLSEDSRLPMIYMDDCIRGTTDFLAESRDNLRQCVYNIQGCSFTPSELAEAIRKERPSFAIEYRSDPLRQGIADSWPNSLDDSNARRDWNWKPEYDIDALVQVMLKSL